MDTIIEQILRCTRCAGRLESTGESFKCLTCNERYKVDSFGVLHMKENSFNYEQTNDSTLELVKKVKDIPAKELKRRGPKVKDLESEYEEFSVEYCMNESRFEWTEVLDVNDKTVLDFGCGFGGGAIYSIKRGARKVLAVDGNIGRLRFLSAWADKEEINSIVPIHADAFDFNMLDEKVDIVIMSGSLEWMGAMRKRDISPNEVQQEILKKVRQFIKPTGNLLVGIENRYALQNFIGYTPHIVEPPFTTILPRKAANLLSLTVTKKPYRVYTYSHDGYIKLFQDAGFKKPQFLYPFPDYISPQVISSTTTNSSLYTELLRFQLSWSRKVAVLALQLLSKFGLAKKVVPSYIIKASK